MHSRIAPILVALVALATFESSAPRAQGGNDAKSLLNANVWYLTWETSFDASYKNTSNTRMGMVTTTSTVKRVFSGARKLGLRSPGPGLTATLAGQMDPSKMSPAEMQKMLDALSAFDTKANWLEGPGDGDANAGLAAKEGPAHLEFVSDAVGDDMIIAAGQRGKLQVHTTRKGDARVLVSQIVFAFEIDSAATKYWVALPYEFGNGRAGNEVTEEVVTTTTQPGKTPDVQRATTQIGIAQFPVVLVDDDPSKSKRGYVVLSGNLDTSGRIVGEQTVKAHYDEGATPIPGTLTFKFTLARTPPAAAPGK